MPSRAWQTQSHDGFDYEWCLASGYIKLRKVGAGKNFVRQWRPRRQGEAYTESEAKLMVEQFFAGTSAAAPAAAAAGEEPAVAEATAPVEEVPVRSGLIVDGVRNRQQTELFEFSEEMRAKATGKRRNLKRPAAADPCVGECPREDCKKSRAERDEALFVAEEAAAQLYAMRGSTSMSQKCPFRGSERKYFPLRGLREKRLFIAKGAARENKRRFLVCFLSFFHFSLY